jgi:hypothetical protein
MATAPSRPLAAATAFLAALAALAPAGAHADDGDKAATPKESAPTPVPDLAAALGPLDPPVPPVRRGVFMIGLDAGAGLGSIVGYPNDSTKIGYAGYYTATGVRPATVFEGWLGAAFTDWFTFGIGFTTSSLFATGSNTARLTGALFRVEAFPLFPLGGAFRDLGVRFDAGPASASVTDAAGDKLVDSSFASFVGGGIFWEALRAWKTNHGPFLMGNYLWSDSARRPAILLGWRTVLYTSP